MSTQKTKLQKYTGKLFIHTPKAIQNGCPNCRIYCVVKILEDDQGPFLGAWKADLITSKIMWHSVHKEIPIENITLKKLCCPIPPNGELMLSAFSPDSFYRQVTLEEALSSLIPEK